MATASPPAPQSGPPPAPQVRAPRGGLVRALAVGALALVVLIVAYLIFTGGGGASYQMVFAEAGQLVKGDQVQVGGVPVGTVTDIVLTKDYRARVTIHVDSSLAPLHEGTVAQVRVPSLSSVANRYIALTPGPNNRRALASGSTLPATATHEVVDLDKLFNTLDPKTRRGLQQFIQGSAEQYAGAGRDLAATTEYTAPSLAATDHLVNELSRDQPLFTRFLVETAKAVTTIGARAEPLSDLIENLNTTFGAIGSQQHALAEGLHQLPGALRQGNRTFAQLPATVPALERFFSESRVANKPLGTLLERLRPLVRTATPTVHDFNLVFNRPGASNDLTDLARALPGLVRELSKASPSGVTSLRESVPITAFFGPYAPDLEGALRAFGETSGYYDANGHYVHINAVFPDFKLGESNTLKPASPQQALEGLKTGQLRRCPGAATQPAPDRSSPFVDGELLTCDPSETP